MNFFQQQLKWILGNQPEFQDAKYVGRACFVPLVDGTRIKAELITRGTHEKYEALKLTAMNKAEGQIDATRTTLQRRKARRRGLSPRISGFTGRSRNGTVRRDIRKRKSWERQPVSMSGCSRQSRQHRPTWRPICRRERS